MAREYKIGDEVLPGYRLMRFLGRGTVAEVWRATGPGGVLLALKIVDMDPKPGLEELRALGIVRRVRHPHITPLAGFWLKDRNGNTLDGERALAELNAPGSLTNSSTLSMQQSTSLMIVAELVIATVLCDITLADRLEKCRAQGLIGIPQKELLHYLRGVAYALDFLAKPVHDVGQGQFAAIVHGSVKPQDMLMVGGEAQLGDFGMARVLGDARLAPQLTNVVYTAPEALDGHPPSASSDQYSLAISYIELRTGRLPFSTPSVLSTVVDSHTTGKLDLSALASDELPIIRTATARDPDRRYRSCCEFIAALRRSAK